MSFWPPRPTKWYVCCTLSACAPTTRQSPAAKASISRGMRSAMGRGRPIETVVNWWNKSLLTPTSGSVLMKLKCGFGASVFMSMSMTARPWRAAAWCVRQPRTASLTVGKNHDSPMKLTRLDLCMVLMARRVTMAKAVRMPRDRKSSTISCRTPAAVASILSTPANSKTRYSVVSTSARSSRYLSSASLTCEALAKYIDAPSRTMKTFGMNWPSVSWSMLRKMLVPGTRQRMVSCGRTAS
mmetsp:Transcript_48839/g.157693  ORF Transcript_48839/g.157693 Transcript_48839/m.157693 type:complete len:240 (+) Transcript_48839:791-1510(+)